ncbi:CvpA family protein [Enterococcus sp. LJL98]
MIGLIILLILLVAFYSGSRRGVALQLVYSGGFLLSFLIAQSLFVSWGEKIALLLPYLSVSPDTKMVFFTQEQSFDLDKPYYAAVAFIGFLILGYLVTKLVGIFASGLRYVHLIPSVDWLVAGVLNLMIAYVWIFLFFQLLTLIPIEGIQGLFKAGSLPRWIVEKSPILSNYFHQMWIVDLLK